jgi:hypothetical protein
MGGEGRGREGQAGDDAPRMSVDAHSKITEFHITRYWFCQKQMVVTKRDGTHKSKKPESRMLNPEGSAVGGAEDGSLVQCNISALI